MKQTEFNDEESKIVRHIHESTNLHTDSIEITKGTPGKEGSVSFKVYVNASDPKEARQRLDNMIELRRYAMERILINNASSVDSQISENISKLKEVMK